MQRTFTVVLRNRPGALVDATSVFAARNANVETLSVLPTAEPGVSQMRIVAAVESNQVEGLLADLAARPRVLSAREVAPLAAAPRRHDAQEGGPVTLADIEAAMARIRDSIPITPLVYSEKLSQLTGARVFLKLENLQMTGSFKERGALNRILNLTEEEASRGLIAASAGNHAQAVAYHATRRGIRSQIVMPLGAPITKVSATQAYGAEVVLHGASFDEAYAEALRRAEEQHLVFVSAFDDLHIIAGQGTLGLEMLEQQPALDAIIGPVGGGGLMGGIARAAKAVNPGVRIIGVEAARVPSMHAALRQGSPVTVTPQPTLADGIAVRTAGVYTLPLVRDYVDEMALVEDEEIANAILQLLEREKILAEGAGAAALAALLHHKVDLAGKKVGVLVCGGNIDVSMLSRIIERGLVKDQRLLRLRFHIPDHPGSLRGILEVVAAQRANVIEVVHDRAYFGVNLGDTVIDLQVETRGPSHAAALEAALSSAGYRFECVQ
jgi:threonine dehydratase